MSDLDLRQHQAVCYSDADHTNKKVKTWNLIEMFYETQAVDTYIAQNLYGGVGDNLPMYSEQYKGLKYFDLDKMAYMTPGSCRISQ